MGIAGQQHFFVLFAQGLERVEKGQYFGADLSEFVAHEKFEIDEDLVVAGAAGVDFFAEVAQFAGEHQFDLGMDVFHVVFDLEITGFYGHEDAVESFRKGLPFLFGKQSDAFQHPDVGLRPFDVVSRQPQIKHAVISDGEPVHDLRGLRSFIP